MKTASVLNCVIEVLRSGAMWEVKGNAAATAFSLTRVNNYMKKLGRKTRMVKALLDLAKQGPTNLRRDAMAAILNLVGDREAAAKLVEGGVVLVDIVGEVMEAVVEEAMAVLEVVVKRGGLMAYRGDIMKKLAAILRDGSDRVSESVAATLTNIYQKGGWDMVVELAAINGIERVVWEIMGAGKTTSFGPSHILFNFLFYFLFHVIYNVTRRHYMSNIRQS